MARKLSYKDKSVAELKTLIAEKQEELRKQRFEAAGARTKDTNAKGKIRREIARILTELAARGKVAK